MPRMASIEELIQNRLDAFRTQDLHLARTESGIRDQRAALKVQIDQLETTMAVVRQIVADTDAKQDRPPPPVQEPSVDLDGLSIADAAERVLKARGGEAGVGDLLEMLGAAGRISTKVGRHATLKKALERHPERFEKAGRGRWRLRALASHAIEPEVTYVTT